jgi:hypothetical protein
MPGPRLGPRPADFDEAALKQSPTFAKWQSLPPGTVLNYACRDFVKGADQDEERLLRRLMIARRNNIRDHVILKQARKLKSPTAAAAAATPPSPAQPTSQADAPTASAARTKRSAPTETARPKRLRAAEVSYKEADGMDDDDDKGHCHVAAPDPLDEPTVPASELSTLRDMDVDAVVATRSYQAWLKLPHGKPFVYNQSYVKGAPNHDWLLRKNIWRRMKYRRQNKQLVHRLVIVGDEAVGKVAKRKQLLRQQVDNMMAAARRTAPAVPAATAVEQLQEDDDDATAAAAAAAAAVVHDDESLSCDDQAAIIEAAVAAAESFAGNIITQKEANKEPVVIDQEAIAAAVVAAVEAATSASAKEEVVAAVEAASSVAVKQEK